MSKRVLRVLHCVGSLNYGGIETWLMNLVRQQPEDLHFDFLVSAVSGLYEGEARDHGCTIVREPAMGWLKKRLNSAGLGEGSRFLEDLLRRWNYDVVHAHGTEFLGDVMKTAAACEVPVRVAHCHTRGLGKFRRTPEMWIRGVRFRTVDRGRILKYATDILACSDEAGRFFVSRWWDRDPRCTALYCGIPLSRFERLGDDWTKSALRRDLGIPKDAIVVGHVGSMGRSRVKNHGFLLRIFEVLARRDSRYHLYLVGDGPLRASIADEVEALGLRQKVTLAGASDDVPPLMVYGFDVCVLPSLYEGLPLVGLEAVAAGLHIVCSNTISGKFLGSFADRVTSLSLRQDPEVWADAVEAAVRRRVTAAEGVSLVRPTCFSINSSLEALRRLYWSRLGPGTRGTTGG